MPTSNRMSILLGLVMLALFPILFGHVALVSLQKLHVSLQAAVFLVLAIIAGGLINIPLKRIVRKQQVSSHRLSIFSLEMIMPNWLMNRRRETTIAINVGGCLIPLGLAFYELGFILPMGSLAISEIVAAIAINVLVCYVVAIAVPGVGIVMPGFVAPLTALASAVLLAPDFAPSAAFVAGVMGPLIGADLLHIDDFVDTPVAVASIGGAGTFDGIVLSGIFAAYLTPM